jgi:hypothetical protein
MSVLRWGWGRVYKGFAEDNGDVSEFFHPSRRHGRVCVVLREQSKTVTRPTKLLVVAPHQRAGTQLNGFKILLLSRVHDVRDFHTLPSLVLNNQQGNVQLNNQL